VVTFGGFWRLARRHAGAGMGEVARSFSKRLFVRALRQLIPEIQSDDLIRSEAGVRAQALEPSGALVDDFLFVRSERALHVCNAPSPAATSSLPIGRMIVEQLADEMTG
jgi:(S)-2-hydroxyglutarate dehydrogenase